MTDRIQFTCKQCGSEMLKVATEAQSMDDLNDAVCADCGYPFTEDDVREQAMKIAEDIARKAFRDAGFK